MQLGHIRPPADVFSPQKTIDLFTGFFFFFVHLQGANTDHIAALKTQIQLLSSYIWIKDPLYIQRSMSLSKRLLPQTFLCWMTLATLPWFTFC